MAEHTRRRRYQYDRILIESDRILTAQFDDAVIYLTGAQLEMLRNVSQYLRNLNTYVSEYQPGYYLTPDASDYDDILAIVADLEETLMGNPNTIWGYYDRWQYNAVETSVGDAYTEARTPSVPAGYVYVLTQWELAHDAGVTKSVSLRLQAGTTSPTLYVAPALPSGDGVYETTHQPLKEDDYVRLRVYALAADKVATLRVWGYMMKVPE